MKHIYTDSEHKSWVYVWDQDPVPFALITEFFTSRDHRGKGIGSKVFQELLDDADSEGRNLGISPVPEKSSDYDRLVAFYKKCGFEFCEADDTAMIRPAKVQDTVV